MIARPIWNRTMTNIKWPWTRITRRRTVLWRMGIIGRNLCRSNTWRPEGPAPIHITEPRQRSSCPTATTRPSSSRRWTAFMGMEITTTLVSWITARPACRSMVSFLLIIVNCSQTSLHVNLLIILANRFLYLYNCIVEYILNLRLDRGSVWNVLMWNFRISLLSETYWKTNPILHPIHTEKLIDDEKPAKRSLPRFVQFHFLFLSTSATCFKRDRLRSNKTREGKRTKKERTLRKRRPQALRPTRRKFFATKSEHVADLRCIFPLVLHAERAACNPRDAKRNRDRPLFYDQVLSTIRKTIARESHKFRLHAFDE